MEKRIMKPDRRDALRRSQDEAHAKDLNDLLEAARRVVGTGGTDEGAIRHLSAALINFAAGRPNGQR